MQEPSYNEMVAAMTRNDASYDGRFYVGVISTGIYCLPSCRAKLPKIENVVFFGSREEAIGAGLRGCKRCRSEKYPDVLPGWLHDVLRFMRENRTVRLTESMLAEKTGHDISTIRRYFKTHFGVTALGFHRRLRLNHAKYLIQSGSDYLSAAYECGYESASGFRDAFLKQFGQTPGRLYVDR